MRRSYKDMPISVLKAIPDTELKHDRDNLVSADMLNLSYAEGQSINRELEIIEAEINRRPIMKAKEAFK